MSKVGKHGKKTSKELVHEAVTKDDRFSQFAKDPRFSSIKTKKTKIEPDKRFTSNKKKGQKEEKRRNTNEIEESSEEEENMNLEMLRKMARGEWNDMESSSSDEDEELLEIQPEIEEEPEEEIEDGEASRRLACVNLNWDIITAIDLLSVFKSFAQGGSVYSVTIYPSEFGKERLANEEKYGPEGRPVEEDVDFVDDENEEENKKINQNRLRKYEKERLRYYFAVIECDNKFTASSIYDLIDGTEFMRTGSIFDLRFVPDDMTFDESNIKDKATFVPENYTPSVTIANDVNSHSNVELSWDREDMKRQQELVKGRSNKKNENGEIDYSAYIASSDEESDEDEEEVRKKYESLLKKANSDDDDEEEKEEEEGDADITFIPGLKENLTKTLKEKEEEKEKEKELESMSAYDRYRQRMKEKNKEIENEEEDMNLFADLDDSARKEKKGKNRRERRSKKLESEEERKKREELELLMIDENNDKKDDFDMVEMKKEIEKKKKGKKRDQSEIKDDFEINTEDDRFKGLVTNSDFGIDVTNPLFVKTKGMEKLVNTVTKKRRKE